ncbi:acetyl-CoA carboxylase biotin carboxylase subunit family protein [Mesorhizobium sp. M6A.T.Cr.TU.016.01.1.1]|uniref:ATP-grasp domain-containing protein n=1 Tax=Mesorhizobium sp. M6A.T.Cr.TU.016.01.1.1 TaxID=2493677 RepID=UPI000F7632A2|nr:acetyl-CoA carboxylase biotin carboxylase subunit family protein [Mesorhizobium sp. M6A.T.Cr.TU.016.01.1.1]AZO66365.1 ATP-grasp domain-containing protein [Mesorhizobium sp. M6A.T.Cr.TU.016.01.1.1]
MSRRALVLVEGHRGNGPLYVQAARHLGLHPVTLSTDPAQYEYLAEDRNETVRVDTEDLDALIRECSQLSATYEIAGITGFAGNDESISATVGKLCQYFDLPGPNPASIERCCDKFAQRQVLAEAGIPIPAYRLAANAAEAECFAAEIGLPVVLKPAIGSGSIGVRLCRNADELAEHTTYLLSGKHEWRSSPRILVEEFAQGPFFSAHTMESRFIGIEVSEFGPPPHFVFRESIFPAPLSGDEQERIADVSSSCLRALDLGWGPTTIELRWTKRGPVVIEVNPRLFGGPEPVQLAYGIDLVTEHIKLVTGDECDLRRKHSWTAATRSLLPDRDGILDWIDVSRAAAATGVAEIKLFIKPKSPIVRRGDYRDTIADVLAVAPTLAETAAVLQHAVSLISWSIVPSPTQGE